MKSYWVERPVEKEILIYLQKEGGFSPFLARYLAGKGFDDLNKAYSFLYPRIEDFTNPFAIPDLDLGVKRIEKALAKQERIGIYADSDADGILGAFILWHFLREISGYSPLVYFTKRNEKGYGFHPEAISYFKFQGVKLIITVDVGIANPETVELAKASGIEVIITDHHEFTHLPNTIVITGKRSQRESLYHLCGAGVVLELITGLRSYLSQKGYFAGREIPKLKPYLQVAAIATLADMVPLYGENRLITYFGLRDLERPAFAGLGLLLRDVKYELTEWTIQQEIISKVNACFREGRPELFFNFLKEEDPRQAEELLQKIKSLNEERKSKMTLFWERVEKKLPEAERGNFVLLWEEGIPKGYLGLLAQRLKEKTGKPALFLTVEKDGILIGSGRSPKEVDFLPILLERVDLFLKIGGHKQSFGLRLRAENLDELIKFLTIRLKDLPIKKEPYLFVDYVGRIGDFLDEENRVALRELPPYGEGHAPPLVLLQKFEIVEIQSLREKHTQLTLRDGLIQMRGLIFNKLLAGKPTLGVAQPYFNSYRNCVEFRFEDLPDED